MAHTTESVNEYLKGVTKHIKCLEYGNYDKIPSNFVCSKHGEYKAIWGDVKRSKNFCCKGCREDQLTKEFDSFSNKYQEQLDDNFPDTWKIREKGYINARTPIKIKHLKCGKVSKLRIRGILDGVKCECERYSNRTIEAGKRRGQLQKKLNKLYGRGYFTLQDGNTVEHKCGHTFRFNSAHIDTLSCPSCNPVKPIRSSIETNYKAFKRAYVKKLKDVYDGDIHIVSKYYGVASTKKSKFRVCSCGHTFKAGAKHMLGGGGCLVCNMEARRQRYSQHHQDVFDKRLFDKFGSEYIRVGPFLGKDKRTTFKHNCGRVVEAHTGHLIGGSGYACSCKERPKPRLLSKDLDSHNEQVLKYRGKEWECIAFHGIKEENEYYHKPCGKVITEKWRTFGQIKACPYCDVERFLNRSLNRDQTKALLLKALGPNYRLITRKVHKTNNIYIKHSCGAKYWTKNYKECPICFPTRGYKCISYDEKVFKVRGFERFALPLLIDKYGVDGVHTDNSEKRQIIQFYYNKQGRRYYPDFYIPKDNLLIEVKSTWTLGLLGKVYDRHVLTINKAKYRACIRKGYNIQFWVFDDNGKRVVLPSDWVNMDRNEIVDYINKPNYG